MILKEGPELTMEEPSQMLCLGHAMTYANVQGRETDGTMCLHDTDNLHFTTWHLYARVSRAKRAVDVRGEGTG